MKQEYPNITNLEILHNCVLAKSNYQQMSKNIIIRVIEAGTLKDWQKMVQIFPQKTIL
jgi:hypothetical protein